MVLLPYIENGKMYDVNGCIIEKPSVLIVEGKIVAYGSYGYLSFKKELEGKKLLSKGRSLMEIYLIPLYELVDLDDCLSIFKLCIEGVKAFNSSDEEYRKFIDSLCRMSSRKTFKGWVKRLKVS